MEDPPDDRHSLSECPSTARLTMMEERFSQHDSKLDKIIDVLSDVKRLEEMIVNISRQQVRLIARADNAEDRIEEIEKCKAAEKGSRRAIAIAYQVTIAILTLAVAYIGITN